MNDQQLTIELGDATITNPPLTEFTVSGDGAEPGEVEFFTAEIEGKPLEAVRVTTPPGQFDPWSLQVRAGNTEPLTRGDVMLARFYVRCAQSMTGEGYFQFVHEKASPDYDKNAAVEISASPEWRLIEMPIRVRQGDFAPGEAQVNLQVGYGDQTIEVAGLEVLNFGDTVELNDLPRTSFSYRGRELDAPWREAAEQRIEQTRKADLTLEVVDADGNAVSGAEVRVEMTRHAFPFGSAVAARMLLGDDEDSRKYRQIVEQSFNEVVIENALKWRNHNTGSPEEIDAALAWLHERDIPVRGHTLIWPGWRNMPEAVRALENDHAALRAAVEHRVRSAAERYAGRVIDWDVINEPITNHDMMDIFGDEVMIDWFRIAREADPSAVLYINDFGILTGGTRTTNHQTGFHKVIEELLAGGAPVQGVGVQGHFSANLTPPDRLMEILDWYTELGLPIKVTEFDINIRDDAQLQSDYLRDFMTVLFSQPNVEGIIIWGFWEGRHWRPEAALYAQDWTLRPHGQVWRDLVFDKWWTNQTMTSDDNGLATVRGFLGDYRITVLHNGREWSFDANLAGQATQVRLALE